MTTPTEILQKCARVEAKLQFLRDIARSEGDPEGKKRLLAMADQIEGVVRDGRHLAAAVEVPPQARRPVVVTLRGLAVWALVAGIYTAVYFGLQRTFDLSAGAATFAAATLMLLIVGVPAAALLFWLNRLPRSKPHREKLNAAVEQMAAIEAQLAASVERETDPQVRQAREQMLADARRVSADAVRLLELTDSATRRKNP